MMTWNSFFFIFPSSLIMELIILMYDYIFLLLFSVLFFFMIFLVFIFFYKFFSLNFFEYHQLEMIWTMVPFFLLVFIVFPSLYTLYMLDSCNFCGMTISVLGHQWYWSYFYKDFSDFSFDSYMLPDSNIRLLNVDNCLLLPLSVPIRFLVSSADVIHSWTVPSLGFKMDALPGRINQFCLSGKRIGVFFGQCSEICGANHSFMPIVLEVVPFKMFLKVFVL